MSHIEGKCDYCGGPSTVFYSEQRANGRWVPFVHVCDKHDKTFRREARKNVREVKAKLAARKKTGPVETCALCSGKGFTGAACERCHGDGTVPCVSPTATGTNTK